MPLVADSKSSNSRNQRYLDSPAIFYKKLAFYVCTILKRNPAETYSQLTRSVYQDTEIHLPNTFSKFNVLKYILCIWIVSKFSIHKKEKEKGKIISKFSLNSAVVSHPY